MSVVFSSLAVLCSGAGVALLHRAWRRRGGRALTVGGWGLIAAAIWPWRATGEAWDKATAFAMVAPPLIALGLVAWEAEARGRQRRVKTFVSVPAAVPPNRSGALWRGLVRTAMAGPLAGAAALGVAVLIALQAPGSSADRLVAAEFILPCVWAGAGVWATMDGRLARVGAGLTAATLVSFGMASL